MLGIPPSDWEAYCVDEALHVLEKGHRIRDDAWADRFQQDPDDDNLYGKIMADPRVGKPPSRQDLAILESAQRDR